MPDRSKKPHDGEVCLNRRKFMGTMAAGAAALAAPYRRSGAEKAQAPRRPNIVLIMTDDQGYGDLGCHGNEKIRTPNLDRLASESVRLTQFYVSPVCAPTRSSLMTGRYNYRTGVVDTYLGRAMMHADEVTLAEMLARAGYRTGIFGKWHLGDNYPMRPIDQGFQETLVHRGGGIGQPSDPPGGSSYFDPILQHNGAEKKYRGYCTDVFANAAMRFVEENRDRPFFAYLATNAPHAPLQIDKSYFSPYLEMGLNETTAKVYGMVQNIDENVGRLLAGLKKLALEENTIVIFLTDNGPQQERYTCGLRGRKGTVYEGGIRVPCFVRWPAMLESGRKIDTIAAHIDVLPTLLDACGVAIPDGLSLDGVSLLPVLRGQDASWPDRTLFFQWHRGDVPELYRACAARSQRYKLVNGKELYDIGTDPNETKDIAVTHPEIVERLRAAYEKWFRDVSATRGYDPPRIYLGTRFENPVTLTRQDWRGPRAGWAGDSLGYWEVLVQEAGDYAITLRFPTTRTETDIHFKLGNVNVSQTVKDGSGTCRFDSVRLDAGTGRLEAWLQSGEKRVGVSYVEVEALDEGRP